MTARVDNIDGYKEGLSVLERARTTISDPKRWTQRTHARDRQGWPVPPQSGAAISWCAEGAVMRCCSETSTGYTVAQHFLGTAAEQLHPRSLFSYVSVNDSLGHEEIVMVYDRAIVLCEKEIAEREH